MRFNIIIITDFCAWHATNERYVNSSIIAHTHPKTHTQCTQLVKLCISVAPPPTVWRCGPLSLCCFWKFDVLTNHKTKPKPGPLDHGQRAGAYAVADALRPKVAAVAAATVDLAVGAVVQVRRVQRLAALDAREAPLVPHAIFADHLLGRVDGEAAAQAAGALGRLGAAEGASIGTAYKQKQFVVNTN